MISFFKPNLGVGVGLRPCHYEHILTELPPVPWFEVITENYLGIGGKSGGHPLNVLEEIRVRYPLVFHGVSLSIGSTDSLDLGYLSQLRELADRFQPKWISDHLCWTGVESENLHDLLPLPFVQESLEVVTRNLDYVQNFLKRPLLIENVSSYLTYSHSEWSEWDFLNEVVKRSGCGILLDVNNVYVSSINHGFDSKQYIDSLPPDCLGQIHLAGHSNHGTHLVDTHDYPVAPAVWDLYAYLIKKKGFISTCIEWDANIPDFPTLYQEALLADQLQSQLRAVNDQPPP